MLWTFLMNWILWILHKVHCLFEYLEDMRDRHCDHVTKPLSLSVTFVMLNFVKIKDKVIMLK